MSGNFIGTEQVNRMIILGPEISFLSMHMTVNKDGIIEMIEETSSLEFPDGSTEDNLSIVIPNNEEKYIWGTAILLWRIKNQFHKHRSIIDWYVKGLRVHQGQWEVRRNYLTPIDRKTPIELYEEAMSEYNDALQHYQLELDQYNSGELEWPPQEPIKPLEPRIEDCPLWVNDKLMTRVILLFQSNLDKYKMVDKLMEMIEKNLTMDIPNLNQSSSINETFLNPIT